MHKTTPLLIAACWMALAGCSKKEEKEAEPIVPVQVTPAREDSIRRIVTAGAVLYPQDQASIMPKISAPVQKFLVNRGDHVRQGQLLAVIENRDLAAAALESKGQYEQAEANYRATTASSVPEQVTKAQTDVQASKQALEAAQNLLKSRQELLREGALARRLVDEAQASYAQARSQYETAQEHLKALQSVGKEEQIKLAAAQVAAAKAHQQAADAQLSYAEVRSPISGVVTDRPVYAGEMASPGSPLLTVMDVSRVVARANIPQNQAASLHVGDAATVNETGGSEDVPGKVIVVSPAVDPNSTTVQVWVQAANPGERLKPGASVQVSIVAATLAKAVVVPPAALLPSAEGGTSVMVVGADSVAHERKVQVGVSEADRVQILSGVKPGEQVITVGGLGLQDGAKVRVEKPGEKPAAEKPEAK
ncbi:MAG TPA: efflux RND transporter periplasmic adaptor subunit [Bryobacterales bacterium]|nr:efflux RND transporter periplasmic adaptor subunit [Bryobacterales bacterium]